MGSVRDRHDGDLRMQQLRQQQQQEGHRQPEASPEPTRATRNSSTAAGLANTSVRDRETAARVLAEEEVLIPPPNRRFATLDESTAQAPSHVPGVRERIERDARAARERATPSAETPSEARQRAADYYYELHKREQAAKAAKTAAEEQRERDRIARQQAEEARRKADEAEAVRLRAERAKMLAVDLALSSATPAEAAKVKQLVVAANPADRFNAERHWFVLQQLRDAVGVGGSESKPAWKL